MRYFLIGLLSMLAVAGCKKGNHTRVDIYLLKSFTTSLDASSTPPSQVIANPVLEDEPLVADADIAYYTQSNTTFHLNTSVYQTIKDFSSNKAFAVTLDGKPVYYGLFHPGFLSSLVFNIATIDPLLTANGDLPVSFVTAGGVLYNPVDHRNDGPLLAALKATGRLR
ncbi:MAG TPA: hypothetical protein VHK91_09430 [Flavisolibacter sp.]|jgi:hypothetical protein|nr:hypothetical protein [Flavisolibacter sp.]